MVCLDKNKSCVRMSILHPVLKDTLTSTAVCEASYQHFHIGEFIHPGNQTGHFITQPTNSRQEKVMGFSGLGEVMHVSYRHHCTSCDMKAHLNPSECQFLFL